MNIELLGENIKRIRKCRGLSQQQLADATGINMQSLSKIERGVNFPTLENLKKITSVLDVTPNDLLCDAKKAKPKNSKTVIIREIETGKELFEIQTGDYLKLERPDGEIQIRQCKVIDPLHVRVGALNYHVDELLSRMNHLSIAPSLVKDFEIVNDYMIVDKMVVGNKAIVIGHNPEAVQPFVTWVGLSCHSDYAWGHYYKNKRLANADYARRIFEERQHQSICQSSKGALAKEGGDLSAS